LLHAASVGGRVDRGREREREREEPKNTGDFAYLRAELTALVE
jgi:hypothetical protein